MLYYAVEYIRLSDTLCTPEALTHLRLSDTLCMSTVLTRLEAEAQEAQQVLREHTVYKEQLQQSVQHDKDTLEYERATFHAYQESAENSIRDLQKQVCRVCEYTYDTLRWNT